MPITNSFNKRRYAREDRRREPRVPSKGTGRLTAAHAAAGLDATIIDVSGSGLQIEMDQPLELATGIELHLPQLTVHGAVENCRPHENGRYRMGIVTSHVVDRAGR